MKSHTKIFLFTTLDIKASEYVNINSVNPLYLMTNKVKGYFEEINGNTLHKIACCLKSAGQYTWCFVTEGKHQTWHVQVFFGDNMTCDRLSVE